MGTCYKTISIANLYENFSLFSYYKSKGTKPNTHHDFSIVPESSDINSTHIEAILNDWVLPTTIVEIEYPETTCTEVRYTYKNNSKFIRSIINYIESGQYKTELSKGEICDFWKTQIPCAFVEEGTTTLSEENC